MPRRKLARARAVVRACRPMIAKNSEPNGCIRWSRTGAADPEPPVDVIEAVVRGIRAPEHQRIRNPICQGSAARVAASPSPLAQGAHTAGAAVTTERASGLAPEPMAEALRSKLDLATPLVAV